MSALFVFKTWACKKAKTNKQWADLK